MAGKRLELIIEYFSRSKRVLCCSTSLLHGVLAFANRVRERFGEKVGNLSIALPTRLLLSINVNTAKSLGIKVPEALLIRADRLIK